MSDPIDDLDHAIDRCVAALAGLPAPSHKVAAGHQRFGLGLLILMRPLSFSDKHHEERPLRASDGGLLRRPEVKATHDAVRVWDASPTPDEAQALKILAWHAPEGEPGGDTYAWTFYPVGSE